MVPDTRTDEECLGATASGDRSAFAELVARHQRVVHRFAVRFAGTEDVADDIVQNAFLAAYRGAETYDGRGSVRAWLLTITRRAAIRHLRPRAGAPTDWEAYDDGEPLPTLGLAAGWGTTHARSPEDAAASGEERAALRRALAALPDADREVIELRDLEGLTGPEAASILGLPLATTKTRLHRARLRLMAALREEVCDDGP